jgi:predicted nucleotidyltransferase
MKSECQVLKAPPMPPSTDAIRAVLHAPVTRLSASGSVTRVSHIMGEMVIDDGLIREIVHRLLKVVNPDRIILFGSAATDQMNADSDIDLLVVAAAASNTIDERVRLLRALRGLGFPFDVFIIGSERFEETKDIFGGIAYPAHKYGRVIYEAA